MPRPVVRPAVQLLLLAQLCTGTTRASAQTFTKVTDPTNAIATAGAAPANSFAGASWIDSDGDGDLDLFISQAGLFRNDGGGAFTRLANAVPSMGLAIGNTWADMDNDGDLDVFVAGPPTHGSALYRNDGGNHFVKLTSGALADTLGNAAWGCAFGDADLDGLIDVVTAAPYGFKNITTPNRFMHNLGNGAFVRVDSLPFTQTTGSYTTPSWSDIDGDGDPDLLIAAGPANGTRAPDYLYTDHFELSPLWFTRITSSPLGSDLHDGQLYQAVDFDNDGDLDLYLTDLDGGAPAPNALYRNDGNGTFVKLTGADVGPIVTDAQYSLASVWQDFDNDGDLDCYVTNGGSNPAKFYRNDGGTFVSLSFPYVTGGGPHWCATAGDYDGDGDMDLFVSGTASTYGLFENTTANGYGWLDLALTGIQCNRSAIGAKVRVRAVINGVPVWQMREVSAMNSFGGQSSLVQHFGLADAATADSVIIEWPGGDRSVRTDVPARTTLAVTQDAVTAVLASLLSTEWTGNAVRLVWWLASPGSATLTVERQVDSGPWESLGAVTLENQEATYVDDAVTPGSRCAYRLRVRDATGETLTAATSIEIPRTPAALVIRRIAPNPTRASVVVTFELPRAGNAALQIIDISGRRILHRETGSVAAGQHALRLSSGRLAPGLYLVRLTQAGVTATARFSVVD